MLAYLPLIQIYQCARKKLYKENYQTNIVMIMEKEKMTILIDRISGKIDLDSFQMNSKQVNQVVNMKI